jgi:hypothetical protein
VARGAADTEGFNTELEIEKIDDSRKLMFFGRLPNGIHQKKLFSDRVFTNGFVRVI